MRQEGVGTTDRLHSFEYPGGLRWRVVTFAAAAVMSVAMPFTFAICAVNYVDNFNVFAAKIASVALLTVSVG